MRREIITWSVVLGIVLAAFGGTVLILNASLYSASGFVRGYLDSLARHDVDGALGLVGTAASGDANDDLLVVGALGELSDVQLMSQSETDGVYHVVYSYKSDGVRGTSEFAVQRQGTLFGLFPTWKFESSPLAVVQLTIANDQRFTANGLDLVTRAEPDQPAPYLAFAPSTLTFGHDSTFLTAEPVTLMVTAPGEPVPTMVTVEANDAFVKQVTKELTAYLDDCTTQQVLLPTDCPFGKTMGNRIITTPAWSMSTYPAVTIEPGPNPGEWIMPPTDAAAHLVVDVRSLFDGSVSTFDEDVPFRVGYSITFLADNELLISAQYP